MTPEQKEWIDQADYETLLRHWRFAKIGDPMLAGDTGKYFQTVLVTRRNAHPDPSAVSKLVGWEKP